MQQQHIHNFLERYFVANDSPILANDDGYLQVQLSPQLDKALMNRPFYWHYLEKTGGNPEPLSLTLITDQRNVPKDKKGEIIHFGSPRLHQIFQSTKELGGFIRLYENIEQPYAKSIALQPWLCLNVKISFQCDRIKDIILSLGLNLIHGRIMPNFFETVQEYKLTPKIPDFCFTLSPLIKQQSGLRRLETVIRQFIAEQDHTWALEAVKRWEEDLQLLNRFYEDSEENKESYELEKEALKSQYEPNILVTVINGGMFYLQQQFLTNQRKNSYS